MEILIKDYSHALLYEFGLRYIKNLKRNYLLKSF